MHEFGYPTLFADRMGTDSTRILNDGEVLHMTLRGVTFVGTDFESFTALATNNTYSLEHFQFCQNALCSFSLTCTIATPVLWRGREHAGELHVNVVLGEEASNGRLDYVNYRFQLFWGGRQLRTERGHGYFDDALAEIADQLPAGAYLKNCFSCRFSASHPSGSGSFGYLGCFRDGKALLEDNPRDSEVYEIWPFLTEHVQEIHCCDEFRLPDDA